MPTATTANKTAAPKPVPVPNGDFYQLVDLLTPEERALVMKVRTYMETKVQPIINKYWSDDAFPFELLPSFKEIGIGGLGYEGYGCAGGSQKLYGFVTMEIARTDASFCTFWGVHSGLPWARSISTDPRSRSRNGCHKWPVTKRSGVSASPSR